jgi:dGTPase
MTALGLKHGDRYKRHPLSYITEIADDICYCVTDCEDAVLMGILDERLVHKWYLNLLEDPQSAHLKPGATISFLRAKVIGDLMRCFTDDLERAFRAPTSLATFEQTSPTWQRLHTLKRNYKIVFDDAAKVRKELNAQTHFHHVLDTFFAVTRTIHNTSPSYNISLLRKYTFGEEFIATHQAQSAQWWLHTMFDFITGMTDAYLHRFSDGLR